MAEAMTESLENIFSDTQDAEPGARKAKLLARVAQLKDQIETLEAKLSVAEVMIANASVGDARRNRRKRRKEAQKKKKREALAREAEEAAKAQIIIEENCGGILGIVYGKYGPEEEKAERYYRSAI